MSTAADNEAHARLADGRLRRAPCTGRGLAGGVRWQLVGRARAEQGQPCRAPLRCPNRGPPCDLLRPHDRFHCPRICSCGSPPRVQCVAELSRKRARGLVLDPLADRGCLRRRSRRLDHRRCGASGHFLTQTGGAISCPRGAVPERFARSLGLQHSCGYVRAPASRGRRLGRTS